MIFSVILGTPTFSGIIALGIHKGTPYYDCTEKFVKDINRILEGYTDGRVIFEAPFIKWNKKMVYDYCIDNHIPIHLTYSCELGDENHCGKCRSCLDRSSLNVS